MKYTYLIATFIFYVNIYSQENNQLFVEYNFKNDYYQNKELLIVKNNKTLYTNDTLNIKGNTKVIKDEEGNYVLDENNEKTFITKEILVPSRLCLNYQDIFVYNIKATQELIRENESLKSRVNTLETQISELLTLFNENFA